MSAMSGLAAGGRKDRWWIIGGIVAAVVLAAISWFFLISPKMDDSASVRDQAASAAQQNDLLQIKVNQLRTDSAGLPNLLKSLDTLHTQLPTTANLDDLTRQLTAQAAAAKVTVTSIVIGVPTVVKAPQAKNPAPETSSPDSGQSGPAGADSADNGATGAAATTPAAPTKAVALNLYAIPVTIAADGPIANQQKLLAAIQTQGPRGALVSAVQFAPAPEVAAPTGIAPSGTAPVSGQAAPDPGVAGQGAVAATMTVKLTVFVAPQSPDDEAALRKQLGG
jgi:hypothetical protein